MSAPLIAGGVFSVLGVLAFVVGAVTLRKWWQIKSTSRSSIRDAAVADGIVEIEGTVQPAAEPPLESPLTERECVAFEYDIRRATDGDSKTPVDNGTQQQSFVIDDGTATAYVDPEDGELSLSLDRIKNVSLTQLPDYIQTNPKLDGTRIYNEGRIETDAEAYIIGSTTGSSHAETDTQLTDTDGLLLISNQDATDTATRLFRRGVFLAPIGLGSVLVGLFILISEVGL